MTRTYVVTGSASGIGKVTAEKLRADGHTVIGVDLKGADINADLTTAEGRAELVARAEELSGAWSMACSRSPASSSRPPSPSP
ncbi:hypothetical protein [Pseudoclavibacter helvolus]|uniref:hypothetical protein n=1 Tax=Pseudoclavibacter helvolus TaxID=255205 RepID=UPI000B23A2CF